MGRTLILIGLGLVVLGALVMLSERLPFRLGRLPGDINIEGKTGSFHFPLMTSLLLSVVLSFLFWLFGRR